MSLAARLGRLTREAGVRRLRLPWVEEVGTAQPVVRAASRLVEGERVRALAVGQGLETGFTHFVDGIQRSQPVLDVGGVPVIYGYVAGAVRERVDRRMQTAWWNQHEALYGPSWLCERLGWGEDTWTAVAEDGPDWRQSAKKALDDRREQVEREAAEWWVTQDKGWLFVDGSLALSNGVAEAPRAVGIIKSHQTQYFSTDEQAVVWELRPGERSPVFEPLGDRRIPVYSWYLRLRDPGAGEVTFGLVRVEMACSAHTLQVADQVSRWLLAETRPLSLPDPRWDRMLYPIRDCEQYLKSRAPSRVRLESLV